MQNPNRLPTVPEGRAVFTTSGRGSGRIRCLFREPELAELLHDPMTLALMAADRVDRGEFDILLAGARQNLRWPRPRSEC
jgi:hypothetical protein